jgi:flagella basal body P-ring formation protein FlgA
MSRIWLGLIYAMVPIWAYAAAPPRSSIVIDRSDVELKDLFGNLGSKGGRAIGEGPAPGDQFAVGKAQLQEIARRYGIEASPKSLPSEIIIRRAGVPVAKSVVIDALMHRLHGSGMPAHAFISLDQFKAPMVPPGSSPQVSAANINYDPTTDKFYDIVTISAAGTKTASFVLSGTMKPTRKVVVATRSLASREILGSSDVTTAWVPDSAIPQHVLRHPSSAYGKQLTHPVQAGEPVAKEFLAPPELVRKGAFITLSVATPGLEVKIRGLALDDGTLGSVIAALNPASHDIIQAVVTARNEAAVDPDSSPVSHATANNSAYPQNDNYYSRRRHS